MGAEISVASRDVAEVRKRIDAERARLDEHLAAFKREVRSAVPYVVAGIVTGAALGAAVVLLLRRGKAKPRSFTITWKLT
jgi:hypothetical protein